jgi:hypothetical protein
MPTISATEQQTSFLSDIIPFYWNAITTQEFLQTHE